MFYRLKQFWRALFPYIKPEQILWVNSILSGKELDLFYNQSPVEQRHAIDVAQSLFHLNNLSPDEKKTLLKAALLHDCGKAKFKIKLWQRVYIVLASRLPIKISEKLSGGPNILSFPLKIRDLHPSWGKEMAEKAQVDKEICDLIGQHHQPVHPLAILLKQADEAH